MNESINLPVTIANLSKSFDNNHVLKNISLKAEAGDSLVIIGPSGTGKSVLIKNMIGLITPDQGTVTIGDNDFYSLNKQQKNDLMYKIGVLFQGGALFDSLYVWQNVAFSLIHNFKMKAKEAKDIAIQKLQEVGLNDKVADLYPAELSGGMQKRAALARAIAANPSLLLLDEPTSGLDPINTAIINDLIAKCSQKLGATTITITHDMSSVRAIAKNVIMLYSGEIVWQGSIKQMEDDVENPYIKQFVNGHIGGPIVPR